MHDKRKLLCTTICQNVRLNFKSITLNFMFIFIFMNLFQFFFGQENSILGVVFIIIMQSSMLLDFTIKPMKNFFIQLLIIEMMVISAFLIQNANPFITIPMNFVVLFTLLYAFTFEYTTALYMPYILSYLFLVFISPVDILLLPKRVFAVGIGTTCVILYHLYKGRNRKEKTVCDALTGIVEETQQCIQALISGTKLPSNMEIVRNNLYKLSHLAHEHQKCFLQISDASMAMLACGLRLENVICLLYDFEGDVRAEEVILLEQTREWLDTLKEALQAGNTIVPPDPRYFSLAQHALGEYIYNSLASIQQYVSQMKEAENRSRFYPIFFSLPRNIKATLHTSPVRIVYAVRVAIILSLLTALVLFYQLPHGKWLLFTVAAVSLPYADDIGEKARNRFLATLLGGCITVLTFVFFEDTFSRTLVMLAFGYLTAYFHDYRFSFACSTIGALGGALLMSGFGWKTIGGMFIIRLVYICLGIFIAYIANRLIYPFRRDHAIDHLYAKHETTRKVLSYSSKKRLSQPQLYYTMMIHSLLQEEKLKESMSSDDWITMREMLVKKQLHSY